MWHFPYLTFRNTTNQIPVIISVISLGMKVLEVCYQNLNQRVSLLGPSLWGQYPISIIFFFFTLALISPKYFPVKGYFQMRLFRVYGRVRWWLLICFCFFFGVFVFVFFHNLFYLFGTEPWSLNISKDIVAHVLNKIEVKKSKSHIVYCLPSLWNELKHLSTLIHQIHQRVY